MADSTTAPRARARRQVFSPRARAGRLHARGVAAERAAHANDQLGVASTGFSFVVAMIAAALCTVMRNPQRSRPCAAKSPSVTSCGSTKESALRKRLRVELAIAYVCFVQ